MQKAHHHIGHLHAGVVDVVLHVHLLPGGAQQAHKGVAENGVAQVADVRGLVGIDAGVLHERVNARSSRCAAGRASTARPARTPGGAIEPRVDVSGAGDLESGKAPSRAERRHDLLRDDLGRLAQLARQFKGDRRGQFAKLADPAESPAECSQAEDRTFPARTPRRRSPSRFCNSRYTSVGLRNP